MSISIVSTLYKSEPYIKEFISRSLAAAEAIGQQPELILVDDGSPDGSLAEAKSFAERDRRIIVVELSRNFGHHRALMAGLDYATSDQVFLIDSDLEEAPELLIEFSKIMAETKADVVFGIHDQSQGSLIRRATSKAFWRSFNWLSDTKTPLNICNVRLMTAQYAASLRSLPETNVFLGGLFYWVGYRQIAIPIMREVLRKKSTYSVAARIELALRSIVSFSTTPLKAIFYLGTLISGASFLIAVFFLVKSFIYQDRIPMGYSSLIISIWFLGGIIIACLGVVGIYMAYIYNETKGRPRVVIRGVHRLKER